MKVSNTAERLKKLMRERDLRQVDILQLTVPIARKYNLDFTKGNLSMYVTGRVLPGQDKLLILAEALDVSEAWLMGYDVPMERTEKRSSDYIVTDGDKSLLTEVESLDDNQKELLRKYIELLKVSKR